MTLLLKLCLSVFGFTLICAVMVAAAALSTCAINNIC